MHNLLMNWDIVGGRRGGNSPRWRTLGQPAGWAAHAGSPADHHPGILSNASVYSRFAS
jgi:hypothetical protein